MSYYEDELDGLYGHYDHDDFFGSARNYKERPGQQIMFWFGKLVQDLETEHLNHIMRLLLKDYRRCNVINVEMPILWAKFIGEYPVVPALIFELANRSQLGNFEGLESYYRELNEGMLPFWLMAENQTRTFRYAPDKHNVMRYLEESAKYMAIPKPKQKKDCPICKGTGVYFDISFHEEDCPRCHGKGVIIVG